MANIQSKSLSAAILAIACLASGYFLYTKFWPNYNDQKAALSLAESEKVRLTDTLNSIETFLNEYKKQSTNTGNVDLLLPSKQPDVANLLANIESLAGQSSVSLAGISVVDSTTRVSALNAVQPVEISFEASGSYLQLKDFISKIQQNLRLMDVYNVTVAANETGGNAVPVLAYQIKLRTYYQK